MAELDSSSYKEMMKFVECPVCLETMYPPIFQCPNGHTFCPECRPKVGEDCAVCHVLVAKDMRSFALEKFLMLTRLSCVYNTEGCTQMISYHEKLQHEKTCTFRPFNCPNCTVVGDILKIVTHLRDTHKVSYIESGTIDSDIPMLVRTQCESEIIAIHKCVDNCYFLLGLEAFLRDRSWFCLVYVMMLGEENEAEGHRYALGMDKGNRRLICEGVPRSCRVSKQSVIDDCDGLLLFDPVA